MRRCTFQWASENNETSPNCVAYFICLTLRLAVCARALCSALLYGLQSCWLGGKGEEGGCGRGWWDLFVWFDLIFASFIELWLWYHLIYRVKIPYWVLHLSQEACRFEWWREKKSHTNPESGREDVLIYRSGTGIEKKTLAKLVTLKGSGSLSPCVYFLNDGCLGNVLKMRQSISCFSVNIPCWCLGRVVKMAINKKVNMIPLLNFPSLVKPKGK